MRAIRDAAIALYDVAFDAVVCSEGMIHDERVAQGSGLADEIGVEILTAEGNMRLTDSRLEGAEIPDSGRAAGGREEPPVQIEHLCD